MVWNSFYIFLFFINEPILARIKELGFLRRVIYSQNKHNHVKTVIDTGKCSRFTHLQLIEKIFAGTVERVLNNVPD